MEGKSDAGTSAEFFAKAMREFGALRPGASARVLDFGCGDGEMVDALSALGYEAYGCDFGERLGTGAMLRAIEPVPYRLPFEDDSFDFVVSTAVLEHAQNIEACHREISRVLRSGGLAMHLFPSKKYLPTEPHIRVPLMSWIWPRRPRGWLALWAFLGIRKTSQRGRSWRDVVDDNDAYLRDHCSYLSTRRHREVSMRVFGNCSWPMRFYIENSDGGVGRLGRRLPFHALSGTLSREFRAAFLIQRNEPRPFGALTPER